MKIDLPLLVILFLLGVVLGLFGAPLTYEKFFKEKHVPTAAEIAEDKLDAKRAELRLKQVEAEIKRLDEELKKPTGSVGSVEWSSPFPFNP